MTLHKIQADQQAQETPWKVWNEMRLWLIYPAVRYLLASNRIAWGHAWSLYGIPILQKHHRSVMCNGSGLNGLRHRPDFLLGFFHTAGRFVSRLQLT